MKRKPKDQTTTDDGPDQQDQDGGQQDQQGQQGQQGPPNAAVTPTQPPEPHFTQADLDRFTAQARAEGREAASKELLKQLREQYGEGFDNLDALIEAKKKLDEQQREEMSEIERLKTDLEQLQQQLETQKQAVAEATLKTLRLKIGQEMGVPPALAERLTGGDEEAIRADAQAVLDAMPAPQRKPLPDTNAGAGTGQRGGGSDQLSDEELAEFKKIAARSGITVEQYLKYRRPGGQQTG